MSIYTPPPTRVSAPSSGLSGMLDELADEGWRVEIAAAPSGERIVFALVARAPGDASASVQSRERVVVLHGYGDGVEVQMKDVWRVVAHVNEIQGDLAVLCLGPKTTVSPMARDGAARVGVVFRRMPA